MPLTYISDAVDGVTDVTAALLNALRDRATNVFLDDAARATAVAAPDAGRPFYYRSADELEGLWLANTAGDVLPPWNMAWGEIPGSRVVSIVLTTATTGAADLLTVTITHPANRNIDVLGQVAVNSATADCETRVYVVAAGTTIDGFQLFTPAGRTQTHRPIGRYVSTAASTTYKLGMSRISGTGTSTVISSAVLPATLTLVDMGPAGAPA